MFCKGHQSKTTFLKRIWLSILSQLKEWTCGARQASEPSIKKTREVRVTMSSVWNPRRDTPQPEQQRGGARRMQEERGRYNSLRYKRHHNVQDRITPARFCLPNQLHRRINFAPKKVNLH